MTVGFHAFWAGFTQPSGWALLLMLATAVVTAAILVTTLTPKTLAGPLGVYLPNQAEDAEGFATREALRLAYNDTTAPHRPRLYVPGNSVIAQALASDTAMKRTLDRQADHDWDVVFLTTPIQGPLDEAALLDYATRHRPGIVALSISTDRLSSDADHHLKYYRYGRIGFRSELADRKVERFLNARPRRTTGIFLLDNRAFYLRNAQMSALRFVTRKPAERTIDMYLTPQTETTLKVFRSEILDNVRSNHRPGTLAVDMLAATSEFLRARGNKIIFFNVPISGAVLDNPDDHRRYQVHLAEAERLSGELGGHYCGLTPEQSPPPSAYRDYYHIEDAAWQERMRARLAECVAAVHQS